MADIELEGKSEQPHREKVELCSQIILRALVISSTLAAAWIMFSDKQSVVIFGIPFDAQYTYSSAFKYFAFGNAVASASSLLSLCFLFISTPQFSLRNQTNYYIFFLHDLLMSGLLLTGSAAATAIGFVGKYGNTHTGWSPICDHFSKFCNRVTTSIAISYFALLCLLLLTIISAKPPANSLPA